MPPACILDPANCEGLKRLEGKIDQLISSQQTFAGAFVKDQDKNPDLIGHRAYHESVIAASKAQEAFWQDLRHEIMRKGIVFLLVTLFGLAAVGLLYKLPIWVNGAIK
jgi:hypothetical protein